MKSKMTLLMLLMLSILVSCSQSKDMTGAKVTLNLSKIVNLSSGLGSGGAILFAKSSSGEQFAKIITGTEENLELVNGDWSFYAVMWGDPVDKLKGVSYCAKSSQRLSGGSASINLNLNNANCADNDFSGGNTYSLSGKNYFSDFFIEECDDLNAANGFTCLRDNQGSGTSYRMAVKGYKKTSAGAAPVFTNETIYSTCLKGDQANNIHTSGLRVNFPSGNQAMPFIATLEVYLGSNDCGVSDPEKKGIYTQTFYQGIAAESSATNKLVKSSTPQCMPYTDTKDKCESMLGVWNVSSCGALPLAVYAFTPPALCSYGSSIATNVKFIKQIVSVPKTILCKNDSYGMEGTAVFPGGMGTPIRPYKICNEWQLNQIGEKDTSSDNLAIYSYKLMNDLDMNKTDFYAALRPTCAGVSGSVFGDHHNFNPLDQVTTIGCSPSDVKVGTNYTGIFNGNNRTIANLRANAKGVTNMGFVRKLGAGGEIKNLNFNNIEVHGSAFVGGVVGSFISSTAGIKNISITGGEVEADGNYAGALAGMHMDTSVIQDVQVRDVDVLGTNYIGGLVGSSPGIIVRSSYRGNINQQTNMPGGYVGGLVGEGTGGFYVSDSFSEGSITTSAQYVGGIVGSVSGTVLNSYSNMAIGSRYIGTDAKLGGIAGRISAGTIQAVYSDSVLSYTGGSSGPVVDGIAASGNASSVAPGLCISSAPASFSGCTMGNLRTGATFLATYGGNWKGDVAGSLPRLQWEVDRGSRPCILSSNLSSFSIQANLGKGIATKPYSICTAAQLKATSGSLNGSYYQLEEDIRLSDWNATNDSIATFGGAIDGRGYALYGLFLTSDVGVNHGIFANNSGSISNLKVVGNIILHSAAAGASGVLAGVNSGVIKKVILKSNRVEGANYVGGVVGSNSGTIDDVSVDEGLVKGTSYVGGIAGNNENIITRVSSRVNISNAAGDPNFFKIAGIAGFNSAAGMIDQAVFSGSIFFDNVSVNSGGFLYTGGIAGYNLGKVFNTMTKNYSQIQVQNMSMVGGLVGYNGSTGSIKTSLALGKLQYSMGAIAGASSFHQTAGYNDGGVIDSNTFFLANNAGGLIGTPTSSNCDATTASFTGVQPSYLYAGNTSADLVSRANIMINGDSLVNYSPFSSPTTNYIVNYNGGCTGGDLFSFIKSYEPSTVGKKLVADFSNMNNFSNFDIAYESWNGSARNVDRLLEYHKAQMDNRAPTLAPPIWQYEEGDATPRLLQVND